VSDSIRLTVAIPSAYQRGHVHALGTPGIVVEQLGPGVWLVEVRVPDESLEGNAWYETLEVAEHEFARESSPQGCPGPGPDLPSGA